MTSPPQPRKPLVTDDLDLGITGASLPIGGGGKRKAANERQRREAEADEQFLKDLDRIHHEVWPDWGKS